MSSVNEQDTALQLATIEHAMDPRRIYYLLVEPLLRRLAPSYQHEETGLHASSRCAGQLVDGICTGKQRGRGVYIRILLTLLIDGLGHPTWSSVVNAVVVAKSPF